MTMPSTNRVRSIWNKGGAAIIGWANIASALSLEALARCGYDGVVIDLQHGAADARGFAAALRWPPGAISSRLRLTCRC